MLISFDSSQGWIDRALGQIIFQMEDPDRLAHFVEIPGRLFGRGESSLALLAIGIESVFDDPRSAAVFFSGTHRVSFDGEKGTLICLAQTGGAQGALSLQNAVHQRRKAGQDEKRREKNHHVFAIANKIVIAIPTMKKTRPKITLKSADHHGLPLEPGVLADPAHPFRRKISTAGGTLALPVRVMNAAPSTGEYEASVVRPNPDDKSDLNRSRHSQSDRQSA
jgi:hypothetical protein